MFDRHLHFDGPPRTVYENTTITEKRAPTDESVKLLKEMESAAREKVLDTVRLEGNGFNAVLHHMEEAVSGDRVFRMVFDWKGERQVVEHRASWGTKPEEAMLGLRDEVAKHIANHVVGVALSKLGKFALR